MRTWTYFRAFAAIMALAASFPGVASAGSLVDLEFCNKFGHTVYIAVAYPQTNGGWVSRGWMSVYDGQCAPFDTALQVPIFYVRAQTDWYRVNRSRRARETWGGKGNDDRTFSLVENSNGSFNYYQAATRFPGVPQEAFFKFLGSTQLTVEGNSIATVTFNADGSTTSSVAPVKEAANPPPSGH